MRALSPIRRRWFRVSLRTLFALLTVLAVGLAWEVNFVRQRKACEQALTISMEAGDGGYAMPYDHSTFHNPPAPLPGHDRLEPSIPRWRVWLGDVPFWSVRVPFKSSEGEVQRIKSLFPEAYVYWEKDELRWKRDKYISEGRDAEWIELIEQRFHVKVPADDVAKVMTVDGAARYAHERSGR